MLLGDSKTTQKTCVQQGGGRII
uniref:Uncharacterized protein n=1 Tax=Anguilla anguilla TaxID=7936 RepID=A0A0E9UBR8_ANGAN